MEYISELFLSVTVAIVPLCCKGKYRFIHSPFFLSLVYCYGLFSYILNLTPVPLAYLPLPFIAKKEKTLYLLFTELFPFTLFHGRKEFLHALYECTVATTANYFHGAIIPDRGNRPLVCFNSWNKP
jgi:hypothetical protein